VTGPLSPETSVQLLGALADVVIAHDLGTGTITPVVSHGLPTALRATQGDALHLAWTRRIVPGDRARIVAGLREALRSGQGSWMDRYHIRAEGTSVAAVVHRMVRLGGTIYHLLQDASVEAEAVRALEAEQQELSARVAERTRAVTEKNAELARAIAHKDQFLASMSHELRTPLNTILGLSEALADGLGGDLTERQRTWLHDIVGGAHHLLGLINDILDLARIDAGRFTPEWQQASPRDLAESSARLVAGAALQHRISIVAEVAPELPAIQTDPRAARQILVNLLGNAVKFSPESATVRLRVSPGPAAGTACFEVIDSGVGIPAERLGEIFQPFVQLDGGRERAHGGTGLGLALVARMVEHLGGSIGVESTVGQGSTFRVTLGVPPDVIETAQAAGAAMGEVAVPVREGAAPAPSAAIGIRPGLKVLIADDNEANVRIFKSFLESRGCQVEVAHDGQAAVEATARWGPAIVLMDVQMPRMDGLQATRLIREQPRFAALPIIAVTAVAMPGDRERCLAAGMTAYLAKPVRLRELQDTIAAMTATHA
jgi:signal transduction histidine kinase/ActR/RegA family two-component response regulator